MDEGKTIQHKPSEKYGELLKRNEEFVVILKRIVCLVPR